MRHLSSLSTSRPFRLALFAVAGAGLSACQGHRQQQPAKRAVAAQNLHPGGVPSRGNGAAGDGGRRLPDQQEAKGRKHTEPGCHGEHRTNPVAVQGLASDQRRGELP